MPQKKRLYAIVNPHAAYGGAGRTWPDVLAHLEKEGFDVTWQFTQKRGHASHLAQEAVKQGAQTIVVIGGDGTMNEIVNGILHDTQHIPDIALIPLGTGADLAKTLGIPDDWREAIEILKQGRTQSIDIGEITFTTATKKWKRYFANVFDAGLGGNVDRIANTLPKGIGGLLTFLFSSLLALITFRPMRLQVWIDRKFVDDALIPIVGVANGQFFGGDMHIAPMAKTDDGFFEILYVKDTNIFKFLLHVLGKVYQAGHLQYKNVYHCQGRELRIRGDRLFLTDVDGEVEKAQEITVSLIPKAIKIRTP
jgi:diacylglycerol kinase (ATP)